MLILYFETPVFKFLHLHFFQLWKTLKKNYEKKAMKKSYEKKTIKSYETMKSVFQINSEKWHFKRCFLTPLGYLSSDLLGLLEVRFPWFRFKCCWCKNWWKSVYWYGTRRLYISRSNFLSFLFGFHFFLFSWVVCVCLCVYFAQVAKVFGHIFNERSVSKRTQQAIKWPT